MQKRMFLALALSLLVIMAFSYLQGPAEQDRMAGPAGDEPAAESTTGDTVAGSSSEPDTQPADEPEVEEPGDEQASESAESDDPVESTIAADTTSGETVPFDVAGLEGHFTSAGASLSSIKTDEYSHIDQPDRLYDLVFRRGDGLRTGLNYPEPSLENRSFRVVETADTSVFRFRTTLDNGLTVVKEYDFSTEQDYRMDLSVRFKNDSGGPLELEGLDFPEASQRFGSAVRWGPGFGEGREQKTQFDKVYWYYGKNDEMQYMAPQGAGGFTAMIPFMGNGDEDKPYKFVSGPVDWSAVSNRYFVAAVIPDQSYDGLFLDKGDESDSFVAWSAHQSAELGVQESRTYSYELYLGPKFYSVLEDFHAGLESTLNYGWFTILTYPLLISLRWIYAVIPNYGIAIILLSIAIKFVLYPLTKKGLVSMQKMKKLQPKMKEIQDKYSDDKEKLNEKLMEFYSEHNVNPIGGCLPMLLQLPIFIALYRMLEYSIELRGAHFALWVTDLSAKDPYYILPVVMGVLMFFQQWYTMSASSGGAMGQQQKMMMYVMPVVFVFLFMRFPVGLVLYWMTNSAVTLLQYWMINRSMDLSEIEANVGE